MGGKGREMDFGKMFGNLGGMTQAFTAATSASMLIGATYTVDCRIMAGADRDAAMQCYLSGVPLMGLGVAGRAGYNTFNPRLHPSPDNPPQSNSQSSGPAKPTRKRGPDGRFKRQEAV